MRSSRERRTVVHYSLDHFESLRNILLRPAFLSASDGPSSLLLMNDVDDVDAVAVAVAVAAGLFDVVFNGLDKRGDEDFTLSILQIVVVVVVRWLLLVGGSSQR